METIETWARIPFNSAWYEVSTLGKVRTIAETPRYLIPKQNQKGAPTMRIRYTDTEGRKAMAFLSLPKLVADAFPEQVPNPHKLPLLGYRDGNELNCSVTNLYYKDYARGQVVTPKNKDKLHTKAIKHALMVADQQRWWNSMSYVEQQEMLKIGRPPEGVKLKEKDDGDS